MTDATAAFGRDPLDVALANFEFLAHKTAEMVAVEDRLLALGENG